MQKHYQFLLSNVVWKLQYGYGIGAEFSLLDKIKHRSSVLIAPLHCDIQIRYTYVLITTTLTYISWKSLLSYKLVNLARVCGRVGPLAASFVFFYMFCDSLVLLKVETRKHECMCMGSVHVHGLPIRTLLDMISVHGRYTWHLLYLYDLSWM
jgi:hypothetical protein